MRHFIAARPVTTRSLGMGEPPSAAGLVAPSGGVLLAAPRSLRAVASAVDLAAVATAADHGLGATVRAKKQSSRRRLTVFGPANAKWTDATIARIMPLHACPARCGARRRGETAKLGSAPCSPSKTSKPYPAIRPASAQASPKGPGRQLTVRTHRQRARASTLASTPIRRTLSQPESKLAPSKRGFSPPPTADGGAAQGGAAGGVNGYQAGAYGVWPVVSPRHPKPKFRGACLPAATHANRSSQAAEWAFLCRFKKATPATQEGYKRILVVVVISCTLSHIVAYSNISIAFN